MQGRENREGEKKKREKCHIATWQCRDRGTVSVVMQMHVRWKKIIRVGRKTRDKKVRS